MDKKYVTTVSDASLTGNAILVTILQHYSMAVGLERF